VKPVIPVKLVILVQLVHVELDLLGLPVELVLLAKLVELVLLAKLGQLE